MTQMRVTVPPVALRAALTAAMAWGSISAVGQVAKIFRRHYINGRFAWASRDVFWMMPVANVFYFCVAALVVWAIARALRRGPSSALVSGVLAGLCVFSVLIPFGGIHEYAVVALAIGAGIQYARMVRSGIPRVQRFIHAFGISAGVLLVVGGLIERQTRELRNAPEISTSPAAGAPNVLLIIWDTVRASSLSLYGYSRPTTPELERLATTSTTFDWAIASAPWTLPTHCSMFTGLEPKDHGCGWLVPLGQGPTTLAEVFGRNGYRTGGFVANRFYATHETGLERGFVTYSDFPATLYQVLLSSSFAQLAIPRDLITGNSMAERTKALRRFRLRGDAKPLIDRKLAVAVTDEFLEWQARDSQPFFAFLNYFDAHDPYEPPAPWLTRFSAAPDAMARYDGGIAYMDDELGRLMRELAGRGLLDNTIVVVTSDHGELHGEHGLFNHGNALYLPLLHVPLVLRYPARVPQGVRISRTVSLRHLARTITDLAGLRDTMPGVNIANEAWQLEGDPGEPSAGRVALSETGKMDRAVGLGPAGRGVMRALIDDRYHYIQSPAGGLDELYAYRLDTAEANNLFLAEEGKAMGAKYRVLLQALTKRVAH